MMATGEPLPQAADAAVGDCTAEVADEGDDAHEDGDDDDGEDEDEDAIYDPNDDDD